MSNLKQQMVTEQITATKTYSNKVSISVLNSHPTDALRVQQEDGTYIVLKSGFNVTYVADAGQVLPDITILTDATNLQAEIVAS